MANINSSPKPRHKGTGHRKRLRERFIKSGLERFLDYEIIELLLTLGTPIKNCKEMAKEAIKKHKGLHGVLEATLDDLQKIKGIGPMNVFGIKLFQAVAERYARENMLKGITLDSAKAAGRYLQEKIGRKKKEHFVALYLDSRNKLIHEETISIGTLNASLVHPREVFKPAVDHLAASIIVAHNHPGGGVEASEDDIDIFEELKKAGEIMGVEILFSIIITDNNFILV